MDIKSISKRLEQLCKERNWSYYRLAKEAGFQQSTLKSIIKEKNMPSLYTLSKICDAFNISVQDFFSSEVFNDSHNSNQQLLSLWSDLDRNDKEKVLIYMHGLLHKEIKEEDLKDELR